MKKILIIASFFLVTLPSFAQDIHQSTRKTKKSEKKLKENNIQKLEEEENDLLFNKHSIFGIKIATDGYGISYEKGKFNTRRRATIFQLELNEKKHPKEYKISSGSAFFSQSEWVTGKRNNFYQIKLGIGQQYLLGTKGNKNGVHVSVIGAAGLSGGMQKPYLVDVVDLNTDSQMESTYPEIFDKGYLELGSAGFLKGWSDVKFVPGAHAKTAMRFDYGKFNEVIGAIEAGINVEYYFTAIQQMTYNEDKKLFFNAYVTILFGKRK